MNNKGFINTLIIGRIIAGAATKIGKFQYMAYYFGEYTQYFINIIYFFFSLFSLILFKNYSI